MNKTPLRVGGVPEHFNSPWYIAIEQGDFEQRPYEVTWRDFPGGTGAMCEALDAREIDVACLLADGALRAISRGSKLRIIGTFVDSPLFWGIHVHADSPYQEPSDLAGEVFAISRNGSGSHLMTYVEAHHRGWLEEHDPEFAIVGNIDGAREALADGSAKGFLWERLMTRPLVDAGEWRQIGVRPSPWPAFLIVAHEDEIAARGDLLQDLLTVAQRRCHEMKLARSRTIKYITRHFELDSTLVASWLDETRWRCAPEVSAPAIEEALQMLHRVGVIEEVKPLAEYVATSICATSDNLPEMLYDLRVGGVYDDLARAERAFGPIDYDELTVLGEFDRHYDYGTSSCQGAARALNLRPDERVLEVGSRLGAAARYFAARHDVFVTGVELRPAFVALARELTRRCGMEGRVDFVVGDICTSELAAGNYHHAISLMVMLHVRDRAPAWRAIYDALAPGGDIFIEDLVLLKPLDASREQLVTHVLKAPNLVSCEEYEAELERAGFEQIASEDLTERRIARSEERYEQFVGERERHIMTHGEEVYESRRLFLQVMRDLCAIGALGAARYTARKPK